MSHQFWVGLITNNINNTNNTNNTNRSFMFLEGGESPVSDAKLDPQTEAVVFPPLIHIVTFREFLRANKYDIHVGAQNSHHNKSGPVPGEISPKQFADAGICHVILGHSQRRTTHNEDPNWIATQIRAAIDASLKIFLCIVVTSEDYDTGKLLDVIQAQLRPVVNQLQVVDWSNIIITYEPVYLREVSIDEQAQQIQDAHFNIRTFVGHAVDLDVARNIPIVYRGNVNDQNFTTLVCLPDVDGFLVTDVSWSQYIAIINARRDRKVSAPRN